MRIKEQLAVQVELRGDLAAHAGDELREAVEAYLRELLDDLRIPAEPSIAIGSSPDAAADDPYAIRIAGRTCGPMLPREAVDGGGVEALAEEIAATIAANRALVLTPAVVKRLVSDWKEASPLVAGASLSGEQVGQVLVDLVRRCIRVAPEDGIGTAQSPSPVPIDSPDRLREAIIDTWREPSMTVFVDPELAAPPDASATGFDYDLSVLGQALLELFVDDLGLLLPSVDFEPDPGLTDGRFRLHVNDLRFPPCRGLRPDEVLVATSVAALEGQGLHARARNNPLHGGEAAVLTADEAVARLRADGFVVVRPRGYVAFATRRELGRLAGSLLLADAVMFQLSRIREDDAAVVDAALAAFDPVLVTAVFRRLLDEQVPIRDAVGILEGMLAIGSAVAVDQSRYDLLTPEAASIWTRAESSEQIAPEAPDFAESVRRHLRWHITRGLADDENRIRALTVDPRWESRLRDPAELDEEQRGRLRRVVWKAYEPSARAGTTVAAITNSEVRRELRRLLEVDFPALPVLSRHELSPEAQVVWIGEIGWD